LILKKEMMCFKMIVNYYSVRGCQYKVYKNRAVLFAPEDTDKELLLENGFIQLIDGRWCRYINDAELNYIMKGFPDNDVTFDSDFKITVLNSSDSENQKNQTFPNILSAISLWFAVIGFVALYFERNPLFLWLIAVVFVVFIRVKYPKNIFSKVLAILYRILIIIAFVLLVYTMIMCNFMCDSCMKTDCNIPG